MTQVDHKTSAGSESVGFGLGGFGQFFLVHAAICLVIVNAEQTGAVWKLAHSAFGGGLENSLGHYKTFHRNRGLFLVEQACLFRVKEPIRNF